MDNSNEPKKTEESSNKKKSSGSKKPIIIGCIAVVVIIAVIAVVIINGKKSDDGVIVGVGDNSVGSTQADLDNDDVEEKEETTTKVDKNKNIKFFGTWTTDNGDIFEFSQDDDGNLYSEFYIVSEGLNATGTFDTDAESYINLNYTVTKLGDEIVGIYNYEAEGTYDDGNGTVSDDGNDEVISTEESTEGVAPKLEETTEDVTRKFTFKSQPKTTTELDEFDFEATITTFTITDESGNDYNLKLQSN